MSNSISESTSAIERGVATGLVGQQRFVRALLRALIANGHVLIEGVPGLAKTRAVRLLASTCDASFQRIQFTPDLLPADIVGTRIYSRASGEFETRLGPIFANFVLADEINRAAPKVQSALLEAMQERQVTLGDKTHPLPEPFFVFATQNPVEQHGTYPLPEAQLDRFLMKIKVDYPEPDAERSVVRMVLNETSLPAPAPVITGHGLLEMQRQAHDIFVDDKIIAYASEIVQSTRTPAAKGIEQHADHIELGASPRASIALVQVARAEAALEKQDAVHPENIRTVAHDVLNHRIMLTYHAQAEGITTSKVIDNILDTVDVP